MFKRHCAFGNDGRCAAMDALRALIFIYINVYMHVYIYILVYIYIYILLYIYTALMAAARPLA